VRQAAAIMPTPPCPAHHQQSYEQPLNAPYIGCIVVVVGGGRDGEPTPQCPDVFYRWKAKAGKDGIICGMRKRVGNVKTT